MSLYIPPQFAEQSFYWARAKKLPRGWCTNMEKLVPGVIVYGETGGRSYRASRRVQHYDSYVIFVPVNAFETLMRQAPPLKRADWKQRFMSNFDDMTELKDTAEEYGRGLAHELVREGVLKAHVPDMLWPFQARPLAWAQKSGFAIGAPTGTGKTLVATMSAALAYRAVLVVSTASACEEFMHQVREFTHLEPYMLKPKSKRRKRDETLDEYMTRSGNRAFVVASINTVRDMIETLLDIDFGVLVFDELHRFGNGDVYDVSVEQSGKTVFDMKRTKQGKYSIGSALYMLRQKHYVKRIGLSATHLGSGRPDKLWAQLDMMTPNGFGSRSVYRPRYAQGDMTEYGPAWDGAPNFEELIARCKSIFYFVQKEETNKYIIPSRVRIKWLEPHECNSAEDYQDVLQRKAHKLRKMQKDGASKEELEEEAQSFSYVRLAQIATKKHKYISEHVDTTIRGGDKVALLTGYIKNSESWVKECEKLNTSYVREGIKPAKIFYIPGDLDSSLRKAKVLKYRQHKGPAVLISTWHALGESVDGMQVASYAAVTTIPWEPYKLDQALGRFARGGDDAVATLIDIPFVKRSYESKQAIVVLDKSDVMGDFASRTDIKELGEKILDIYDEEKLVHEMLDDLGIDMSGW